MGILEFFKGKRKIAPQANIQKIEFDDVGNWVSNKESSLRGEEKVAVEEILAKLDRFYVSLGHTLGALEAVDLEKKKEHGRTKILVLQGLDKYIDFVRGLMKDLKSIPKNDLSDFSREISKVFVSFERSSAKVYERATYLVGDEMMAVRNEIRKFYNGLAGMFEGALAGDLKKVVEIRSKLDEVEKIKVVSEEVEREISMKDKEISKANDKVKKLKKDIDEIKDSSEYIAGLKDRDEISKANINSNKEIEKLKGLIDFKRLTHIVHSNDRELRVVKDYKERFVSEFSRDNGKKIIDLLAGSNMKSAEIGAQVDLIERKKVELEELKNGLGIDYTVALLEDIKKVEEGRESIELENIKGARRLEELKFKLNGMKNEVVGIVEKFGESIK